MNVTGKHLEVMSEGLRAQTNPEIDHILLKVLCGFSCLLAPLIIMKNDSNKKKNPSKVYFTRSERRAKTHSNREYHLILCDSVLIMFILVNSNKTSTHKTSLHSLLLGFS